jgi:hypothetical protein
VTFLTTQPDGIALMQLTKNEIVYVWGNHWFREKYSDINICIFLNNKVLQNQIILHQKESS